MADTTVKYIDSTMTGAPVLNGTAGSLIGMLDACLVTGFGTATPDSVVVAGGTCTVTRAAGHPFQVGMVALLAGAVNTGAGTLNGEQKVLTTTATAYTFGTTVSDQMATGSITHKVAPAGWTKKFTGTNLAVYQSSDPLSTKMCLRVDDTGTTNARITCFETMSDINTGTGQFPTSGQQTGGLFWSKSSNANATANLWIVAADGRFFYTARAFRSGNNPTDIVPSASEIHAFGDIFPTKVADPYACLVSGESADRTNNNIGQVSTNSMAANAAGAAPGLFMPRAYTGLGTSNLMGRAAPSFSGQTNSGFSGVIANGTPFPNPTDGGLYLTQQYIFDAQNASIGNVHRGYSPGFYCTPQTIGIGPFNTRDIITGVTGLVGKVLRAVVPTTLVGGVVFLDTTGPWR